MPSSKAGHGGHFFGTSHTMANYTTAFYEPLVSDWSNFETWSENGSANRLPTGQSTLYRQTLAEFEEPPIDANIRQSLEQYARRAPPRGGPGAMKLQERVTLFQDRLQRVITHSGLNRSSFATSIRVDRSTLSQLLSPDNVRLPRADTVLSIAEVYQVSIDWLLGITQEGGMGANIVHEALKSTIPRPASSKRIWNGTAMRAVTRFATCRLHCRTC